MLHSALRNDLSRAPTLSCRGGHAKEWGQPSAQAGRNKEKGQEKTTRASRIGIHRGFVPLKVEPHQASRVSTLEARKMTSMNKQTSRRGRRHPRTFPLVLQLCFLARATFHYAHGHVSAAESR